MRVSIVFAIVFLGVLLFEPAGAVIYQYTDDEGTPVYTNDLSDVPADKLDQMTEIEETESEPVTRRRTYSSPTYPILQDTRSEDLKKQREREKEKEALEAEYADLLAEQEAMDNDASFQKRRTKRKYQNRPYIQEMVAREAEIKQRLKEIEGLLKGYE